MPLSVDQEAPQLFDMGPRMSSNYRCLGIDASVNVPGAPVGVKIGFESGNQEVVDTIVNKRLDLEYARQAVAEIKRTGMTVHGTFTYGLPGETATQMFDTKRYISTLGLDTLQESGTAEIEGTPLHTLRNSRSLAKYSGAKLDDEYVPELDGRVKYDRLAALLRTTP